MKLQNTTEHSFQLVVGKPIKPSVGLTEPRNVITLKNFILKTATLIFNRILNGNIGQSYYFQNMYVLLKLFRLN